MLQKKKDEEIKSHRKLISTGNKWFPIHCWDVISFLLFFLYFLFHFGFVFFLTFLSFLLQIQNLGKGREIQDILVSSIIISGYLGFTNIKIWTGIYSCSAVIKRKIWKLEDRWVIHGLLFLFPESRQRCTGHD